MDDKRSIGLNKRDKTLVFRFLVRFLYWLESEGYVIAERPYECPADVLCYKHLHDSGRLDSGLVVEFLAEEGS